MEINVHVIVKKTEPQKQTSVAETAPQSVIQPEVAAQQSEIKTDGVEKPEVKKTPAPVEEPKPEVVNAEQEKPATKTPEAEKSIDLSSAPAPAPAPVPVPATNDEGAKTGSAKKHSSTKEQQKSSEKSAGLIKAQTMIDQKLGYNLPPVKKNRIKLDADFPLPVPGKSKHHEDIKEVHKSPDAIKKAEPKEEEVSY